MRETSRQGGASVSGLNAPEGGKTPVEGVPDIISPAKSPPEEEKHSLKGAPDTRFCLPDMEKPAKSLLEGVPNTLHGAGSALGEAPGILRAAFLPLFRGKPPSGLFA